MKEYRDWLMNLYYVELCMGTYRPGYDLAYDYFLAETVEEVIEEIHKRDSRWTIVGITLLTSEPQFIERKKVDTI